jgi:hypothetical protein
MKLARGVPLVVALLFVVRVAACGGAPSRPAGPAAASGECAGGTISYTVAGQQKSHQCDSPSCSVDQGTGSARCDETNTGVPPFWTCRAASDCAGATFCRSSGDTVVVKLGSPECIDGVCDWKTESDQSCTSGDCCGPPGTSGASGGYWTTSSGFPWGHDPAGAGGSGGGAGDDGSGATNGGGGAGDGGSGAGASSGYAGGTTSGGFPWGAGGVGPTTSGGFPWMNPSDAGDAGVDARDAAGH